MTRELDCMSDQAPGGRMPGRTAVPDTFDKRWTQRCIEWWSHVRDLLHGLRVAWVSTASALIGFFLYWKAAQAQDLFLEIKGHWLSEFGFWLMFYVAVVFAWALPVFVSARWILVRFEEGPHAHPHVQPVKTWVRRWLPLLLGAACLGAVVVGQLMAMSNVPTIQDSFLPDTMKQVVAGRENVARLANAIAVGVMLWFGFIRPSGSHGELMAARYARWVFLTLASFTFLAVILQTFLAIGVQVSGVQVIDDVLFLTAPALSLLIVGVLAWRRMERSLWWIGTISAIPIAILIVLGFSGYVLLELQSAFGLVHLVVLPAFTVLLAVFLWWALAPFPDGRASRFGQLLHHIRGGRGEIGEDEATLHFIKPLFSTLFSLTFLVIGVLVVVHPLNVTGLFRPHRAVLLPIILGMPVALLTYFTHWSARVRAPLIFMFVLATALMGLMGRDNYKIRTVQNALPRMTLKAAVDQWKDVNCEKRQGIEYCPEPVIIAAAGGASRSAFHVAGVIGNLLDEQRFSPLRGHRGFVMDASLDSEDKRILTASSDGTARIWNAVTGQLLRVLPSSNSINSAKFSPNGKLVVTASADKAAMIWDAESGEPVRKLEPHDGAVTSAEFSGDGELVVTTSKDGRVRIWRVANLEPPLVLSRDSAAVNSAGFSPDGTKVASGSDDGTIRIWNVARDAKGQEDAAVRMRHDGAVRSVAFSPDGMRLITASDDRTARVWEAATGKQLRVLRGHIGWVHRAAFSHDGMKIVTAAWDGTARIWDASSYELVKVLHAHSRDINSAAFSWDNKLIVTASDDGTARVWNAGTYERHPWKTTVAQAAAAADVSRRPFVPFGKRLFAISAVSGGSLGAVLTYAALADARRENLPETGIGLPPCKKEGLDDGNWFGAPVQGQRVQPANPVESWRDCLQLLSAGDFLSPVFVGMVSNDALRFGLRENRAVVLEHAWEVRYARLTGEEVGLGWMQKEEDADTMLAQSLSEVRRKAEKRGLWLPILLLNGTSVETGRRIVTSDVDTLVRDAKGQVTGRVFSDSYDLHELFGRPASEDESVPPAKPACQGCDIRLSTAGTMSARFPVISPPGSINRADGKIIDRVVDGGYYEYFGATTAMELADALPKYGLPRPIVILINNDPHSSKMECVPYAGEPGGLEYPSPQPTPWFPTLSWFPTFSSPLGALWGTQNARATHAAVNLCNREDPDRFIFITVKRDPTNPTKELSMSWWLSKHVQKYLDEQIDDQNNLEAFEKISRLQRVNRMQRVN